MKNGCNNRPRPAAGKPLLVQDGYVDNYSPIYATATRTARWVFKPFVMSTECKYDASATDPGCAGCQHRRAA